jgi:hypothetical protein
VVVGCGEVEVAFEEPIPEQVVRGAPLPAALESLFEERVDVDFDVDGRIEDDRDSVVNGAFVDAIVLRITDSRRGVGDVDHFGFVERTVLFLEPVDPGSERPRIRIASATVPGTPTELRFDVEPGVDVLPYLVEGAALVSEASAAVPPDDVSFDGELGLRLSFLD